MQTVKCDRCGKELDWRERRHAQVKSRGIYYLLAEDYDFCKKCKKELEDMFDKYQDEYYRWLLMKTEGNDA